MYCILSKLVHNKRITLNILQKYKAAAIDKIFQYSDLDLSRKCLKHARRFENNKY